MLDRAAPQSAQTAAAPPQARAASTAVPATAGGLLGLQRAVGNAAVAAIVQRSGVAPVNNIATLDELLDRFNTPEEEVIALCGRMTASEKHTVLAGYRDRLASALNFDEMRRAVHNLGAELPVQLDWMQAAATLTSGIDYGEIRAAIVAAPQSERDMLRNQRWKSFFLSVCDNHTILTAVTDLHFDLPTQLSWVRGEASALMSLDLAIVRPLLTAASAGDLAIVGGDAWLPFWTDVCTNATMPDLVNLLFPGNLRRQLEWMAAEGTNLSLIRTKVAAADAAQKLAVFASSAVRAEMVSLCDDDQMLAFVLDLGGDWPQWRGWAAAEGAPFIALAAAAVARNVIADPSVRGFVSAAGTSAVAARDYLRNLPDAQLPTVRGWNGVQDVIGELTGSHQEEIRRALAGEIAREEESPHITEHLQAGTPAAGPFVDTEFALDSRYTMSYQRDHIQVDVPIKLTPASGDAQAAALLPGAIATWRTNIVAAWDNQFRITNGQRTIPLRFDPQLGSTGANEVTVHSGVWAWPNLNAGNWFVPDPVNVPAQAAAVSLAPVHEFGHLIGNPDEYSLTAAHYVTVTGSAAATDPNAIPETDTAGTTRYSRILSVMGIGGPVLQQHVTNILGDVNRNLRAGEPAFTFAP